MSTTAHPQTGAMKLVTDKGAGSGIWVAIFAITMSFAAFISALYVRQGASLDWTHLVLPRILYANTLALLLSSATIEIARRAMARRTRLELSGVGPTAAWLSFTFLLGGLFVAGQYEAWRQLAAQGLYIATNPNSSFFYVFTGMHALHLLGGIAALLYLIARLAFSRTGFRRSTFESTAIYWHFMGILWLYLFVMLRIKL